jgi:Gpi18-like mannosyltransferase
MTDLATRPVETDETQTATYVPSRWQIALASDWVRTLALLVSWHLVLIVIAVLFQNSQVLNQYGYPKVLSPEPTLLSHMFRFDATYYIDIVNSGYDVLNKPYNAAFYPMFPMVVWVVHKITFGQLGILGSALVVNVLASWIATTALLKIARHFFSNKTAQWLTVALFLTAPAAFFLHVMYSEALFCALGFWAYLFALRRQWVRMGLCLMPLTASRITAVLFVVLCLLEFCRAKHWRLRDVLSWHLLWFPMAFVGLGGYMLYLQIVTEDPTANIRGHRMWPYQIFNPNIFSTISREITATTNALWHGPLNTENLVNHILPLTALIVLGAVSCYLIYALRGAGVPLGAFGLVSIVMLTLNSNIVSVHRYVLPCIGIYLGLVLLTERRPVLRPLVYGLMFVHTLVFAFIYSMFISGSWSA